MRHVEIHAFISGENANSVFDTLSDFSHYAKLVDAVVSVDMIWETKEKASSRWVVKFRNGLLKWTEDDWFYRDKLQLCFSQTEGDFEAFYGCWFIEQTDQGVKVILAVEFDFGIPTLAMIVNPVGARVLTDQTQQTLLGLFGDRVEFLKSNAKTRDLSQLFEMAG